MTSRADRRLFSPFRVEHAGEPGSARCHRRLLTSIRFADVGPAGSHANGHWDCLRWLSGPSSRSEDMGSALETQRPRMPPVLSQRFPIRGDSRLEFSRAATAKDRGARALLNDERDNWLHTL